MTKIATGTWVWVNRANSHDKGTPAIVISDNRDIHYKCTVLVVDPHDYKNFRWGEIFLMYLSPMDEKEIEEYAPPFSTVLKSILYACRKPNGTYSIQDGRAFFELFFLATFEDLKQTLDELDEEARHE